MNQRLTDLLTDLRERFARDARPDDVAAYLAARGYDRRQIGEILDHLFPDLEAATPTGTAGQPAAPLFRVQGLHERGRFAPDAWGHLLALAGTGTLGPVELELVIERAMTQIDGRIALDDLRAFMEAVGLDEGGSPDKQTVH